MPGIVRRPLTAWPNLIGRTANVSIKDVKDDTYLFSMDPRDALELAAKLITAANSCFDQRWKPEVL